MKRIKKIEPDVVYHYTSLEALMKIVKDEGIWGTSILYLNDVSERDLFMNAVRERMPNFRSSLEQPRENFFGYWEDEEDRRDLQLAALPFVASFSSIPDSLTHWGMYCPQSNGVSIGFRTECLQRAKCKMPSGKPLHLDLFGTFGEVKYVDSPQDAQIDSALLRAYESSEELVDGAPEDDPAFDSEDFDFETIFASRIEGAASFYKHSHFANEKEYRLLLNEVSPTWLKFRAVRSALVPYVEFSIPARVDPPVRKARKFQRPMTPSWDAISDVVIGPSPNLELTAQAVEAFFLSQGMDVTVKRSQVPFRVW